MAADLHIHVFEEMTEEDLAEFFSNTLGSRWFQPELTYEDRLSSYEKVSNSPNVWVGEVSWLKAAFVDDNEKYIPDIVGAISDIFHEGGELVICDDELVNKIKEAYEVSKPHFHYSTASSKGVLEFLEENKGKQLFTVGKILNRSLIHDLGLVC